MKRAGDIAANILKLIPEKGFSIAVLRVEGRLRLQRGFTSDHKVLEQAVSAATEPEKPGHANPSADPSDL